MWQLAAFQMDLLISISLMHLLILIREGFAFKMRMVLNSLSAIYLVMCFADRAIAYSATTVLPAEVCAATKTLSPFSKWYILHTSKLFLKDFLYLTLIRLDFAKDNITCVNREPRITNRFYK